MDRDDLMDAGCGSPSSAAAFDVAVAIEAERD